MRDSLESARPIRVMLSVDAPQAGATQFVDHIIEGAADGVTFQFFGWKEALRGGYDVFHVHWPERLARRGTPRTVALLTALWLRRIPLVRTVHNLKPHETITSSETWLLDLIDRRTTLFIRLNDHTVTPRSAATATIPHPHYLDRVTDAHRDTLSVAGRVLYFGTIRPYKGVDALLRAFAELGDTDASIRFVGKAAGSRGDSIRAAEVSDPKVSSRLEFVDDDALMHEIRQAELVVLPHRDMHNSGSAFLALSLERPILVPRNAVTEALAIEVGEGWIHLYEGDLSGTDVSEALTLARQRGRRPPQLDRRGWAELGLQARAAYDTALDAMAKP